MNTEWRVAVGSAVSSTAILGISAANIVIMSIFVLLAVVIGLGYVRLRLTSPDCDIQKRIAKERQRTERLAKELTSI